MSIATVTTTADSGKGSLRAAIATAKSGDTIRFDSRLSNKTIKLRSGDIDIDKDLTIDGSNAGGLTISGNQASRVFSLERRKKATLKNLTIANGKTRGAGGGIKTRQGSDLTLIGVNVNNNTSEIGGGLRVGHLAKATIIDSRFAGNDGTLSDKHKGVSAGAISHDESRGQLTIKGTTFENNRGFNGGAIFSFSSVSFTIEDSIFKNNSAKGMEGGGAIFTDGVSSKNYSPGLKNDGKIIIRGSRFEGNTAEGEGGAALLWGYIPKQGYKKDTAVIEDTVFINNKVTRNYKGKGKGGAIRAKIALDFRNVAFVNNVAEQQGGALWLDTNLQSKIQNSTFSGNQAIKDAGGAMFLNSGSVPIEIENSTIAYNEAGRANGAIWLDRKGNVTVKNSIVAFNTAKQDKLQSQVGVKPNDGGGNLEFSTVSKAQRVFENSRVADPKLGELLSTGGTFVHPLKPDSPAINAGVSSGAPQKDQRGSRRDSRTDIGAFELTGSRPDVTQPSLIKGNVLVRKPSFSKAKSKQPVVYLDFDENSGRVAKDASGKGQRNSGKLVGKKDWVAGKKGNAISLHGESNAVYLDNSVDINLGTHKQRTVSLWFNADDIKAKNKRQVLYEEGAGSRGLSIYLDRRDNQDRLYVGGWNRSNRESNWKGTWLNTDKVSTNQWHRVDLVLDGGRETAKGAFQAYLDGQQIEKGGRGSQLWQHGGGIGIGGVNGSARFHDGVTSSSNGFDGKVDEFRIFNEALSVSEIDTFL